MWIYYFFSHSGLVRGDAIFRDIFLLISLCTTYFIGFFLWTIFSLLLLPNTDCLQQVEGYVRGCTRQLKKVNHKLVFHRRDTALNVCEYIFIPPYHTLTINLWLYSNSVLATNVIGCGFEHWSDQVKNYRIGPCICYTSAKYAALRSKNKD